jgi:hypothetical protein
MANRNSSFGEGQGGAKGAESGIIKPAVERPALQSSGPGAKNQPSPIQSKVVDPDRPSIFVDPRPIDEKELATSRKRYVLSGGEVSDTPKISRNITTPQGRNASSKEAIQRLGEHYSVMSAFANTHSGAVTTAQRAIPEAFANHATATKHLSSASENLALAKDAFASRNSAKGNGHLQSAASGLVAAHSSLNHKSVREVTGTEVPIHKDELSSWKQHASNLPAFRRKGKPFSEVNVAGNRIRISSRAATEVAQGAKGTMLGDKVERAKRGTPRTPKWERENPSMPTRSEKGTGVIDTTTKGTAAGTTGEMDPRRKASKTKTIRTTLAKTNLPKIGDTSKKAKKPMKPGDVVEGR